MSPMLGRKQTKMHRNRIAEAMRGNTNGVGKREKYGPMKRAHKAKLSISLKRFRKNKNKVGQVT